MSCKPAIVADVTTARPKRALRPIRPLEMRGVARAAVGQRPEQLWVRPADCRLDPSYQRELSGRSRALIRRMIEGWDWRLVQAITVCEVLTDDAGPSGLWEVIDGQHRVMAALCHGGVPVLPATVLPVQSAAYAAQAFSRLNAQRVGMTAGQQMRAALAAGDPEALSIASAAEAAGVKILFAPAEPRPSVSMAVGALRSSLKTHGSAVLTRALRACAEAGLTPIKAPHVKAACAAVATLGDELNPARLTDALADWSALEDAADLLALDSGQSRTAARAAELTRRAAR
jgi:hypothetical protein